MVEIWKQIDMKNYEQCYEVSSTGKIRRIQNAF